MNQRTRLIEMGEGEGNSKFHRGKRNATFQDGRGFIPRCNFCTPRCVIAIRQQLICHLMQQKISHLHPIGGGVRKPRTRGALWGSIVISAPHKGGIKAQIMGDMIHHPFNPQNALWPPKPAKGRGRLHIGL